MNSPGSLRADARAIVEAGIAAVRSDALVRAQLAWRPGELSCAGHIFSYSSGRLVVVGAGKAAAGMAQALEQLVGPDITDGAVVVKYGHSLPLRRLRTFEAGHPVPDAAGLSAAQSIMTLVDAARAQDLVVVLLTGGASALLTDLPPGATLAELQRLTHDLLRAGADITALNTVRKHLSQIKGGHLLRRAQPAQVLTLAVSDVIGDPLEVIASGPTVSDPSTYAEALEVLSRYGVSAQPTLHAWLEAGARGLHPETVKSTDAFAPHLTHVVGNNAMALAAAAAEATRRGYPTSLESPPLEGDAEEAARAIVRRLRTAGPGPRALLWGGETTVRVSGQGLGGRCQHLALAAMAQLGPDDRFVLLAAGTDGTDGPTEAAGAWADAEALRLAQVPGLDLADALTRCDSATLHQALDTALITGPTGTNVMDVVVGLIPA